MFSKRNLKPTICVCRKNKKISLIYYEKDYEQNKLIRKQKFFKTRKDAIRFAHSILCSSNETEYQKIDNVQKLPLTENKTNDER